ncbi:NAD(P)-dependent oxidoreductase [Tumebacillus sp. DT12]|uniref:NAD(P)-dependent oxidoreductase n=1 Tax=Tumebacillus lacus TaxID=2995335 RepID=A0ABT3X4D4_9BACL|nr:NAD(P)-dependent oxidoreductase [Tumebacillus lacus]MCX7571760.1 NAD(P)-dependent oxidoreductase [Tumebacillus lacus]
MTQALPKLGWIGLGNMGIPMVANLLAAGYDVTVYNRTLDKADALRAKGAQVASTAQELVSGVDIVITMLTDSATVEAVLFGEAGAAAAMRAGQTLIDMSTIAPETSRSIGARLRAQGIGFLDAPVSGSVKPATDGTLVILVGGDKELYETCSPIFRALGKASYHFGENGQGANAKLAVNLMLGITMQGLSEALVLAEKTGLDRQTVLDMFGQTAIASPILAMKTPSILAGHFDAAFALKHMEKDFGLALEAAKTAEASLPATSAAHQTFVAAKANGHGDQDIAVILLQLEAMSGINR